MNGFETAARADDAQWRRAETLNAFRTRLPAPSLAERQTIIDAAIKLVGDYYAHLPLKRASKGIDPVARLRFLRRLQPTMAPSNFDAALSGLFDLLGDLHTDYVLPGEQPLSVAFLPFQLGRYIDGGADHVIVTRIAPGFEQVPCGAEIVSWNGVPILLALERAAERSAGANPAARRAHALAGLTLRPLARQPPPDENWISVEHREGGKQHLSRVVWRVSVLADPPGHADSLDLQADGVRRARGMLFAPRARAPEIELVTSAGEAIGCTDVPSQMPGVFRAARLAWRGEALGYLRIRSFVADPDAMVAEFARLLAALPPRGLVLDLRDNGGGSIRAAERSLQLLTPGPVSPAPMQLLATPAVLHLCEQPGGPDDLAPWASSIRHALDVGGLYSAALPLTNPAHCNDLGQHYHGPVALVVNAMCYSAADIFAAGFQDHEVGPVLSPDTCTGAGGANCWTYTALSTVLGEAALPGLPVGAGLRVALRRSLRVGRNAGVELEERGVVPDHAQDLTRRDLLHGAPDLIAWAAGLLLDQPWRVLDVTPRNGRVAVRLRGADRLDVVFGGRVLLSQDVAGDVVDVTAPKGRVSFQAYNDGILVASRIVAIE